MFKKYIQYLKDNPNKYWFKAKLYGWGWTPVTWQGWLAIVLYVAAILFFVLTLDENSPVQDVMFTFILPIVLLTLVLIYICYKTGEKPGWRWGIAKSSITIKRISHVNLYSDKNEDLVRFYRDVLGLKPLPKQSDSDSWYGFETEGAVFAIEPERNRNNYRGTGVNLGNKILIQLEAETAEELEALNKQLESKGVKLINRSKKTKYGLITNFIDPDSNLVEILCPKG